ncbi:21138_t:CDS:2 [Gigaspora margarita]|uniref:21138_t:CDS:1 n=1 Tax=Gigaspora margarita TaxID=4874 RepID=A0ABN7VGI3_GIGMA|nr:21138_t:CDS:2 [Gigaspora margarita]
MCFQPGWRITREETRHPLCYFNMIKEWKKHNINIVEDLSDIIEDLKNIDNSDYNDYNDYNNFSDTDDYRELL